MALSNDFYTDGFGVRLEGDNMNEQIEELLKEFGEESTPTRRVLERIPEQHLLWKPHPTSTPMGILAMHETQRARSDLRSPFSSESNSAPDGSLLRERECQATLMPFQWL